jgi:uncharacterized protein
VKHKAAILIAIATLLWCVSPLRADEASKSAKAEELLKITQGGQLIKMMEPMMNSIAGTAKPDMPAEERARIAELQRKITELMVDRIDKATPAIAKVYADVYTEEEIDGILAFYKSRVGKAFLEKMPQVMQGLMPAMMGLINGLQPEIRKMTEEMRQNPK